MKEANPGIDHKDIMGKLAAGWKALGDEDKKPYLEAAEELKHKYKLDKAKYDAEKASSSSKAEPETVADVDSE